MKLPSGSTGSVATDGPEGSAGAADGSPARSYGRGQRKRNWNRWTPEEHALLATLVQQLGGSRSWSAIAAHIPGRTGKQCRERWINHQDEDAKTGAWSAQEEYLLVSLHSQHGTQWSRIARHLPGRSDNTVKNCWNATWKCRTLKKPHSILWLYSTELKAGRRKEDAFKYALLRWELHVPGQQIMDIVGYWPSKQWPDLVLKLPPDEGMAHKHELLPAPARHVPPRGVGGSTKSAAEYNLPKLGMAAEQVKLQRQQRQHPGMAAGQQENGSSDTSSQVHGGDVTQQGDPSVLPGMEAMEHHTPGTQHVVQHVGSVGGVSGSGAGEVKAEPSMQAVHLPQEHVLVDQHGHHHMAVGGDHDQGWGAYQYMDQSGAVVYGLGADQGMVVGPAAPHGNVPGQMHEMLLGGHTLMAAGHGGMKIIQQGHPQQWMMPMPVMQQQAPTLYMMGPDGQLVPVVQQQQTMPTIMMLGPNGQLIPVQTAPQPMQMQQLAPMTLTADGWMQQTGAGSMQLQTQGSNAVLDPQQQAQVQQVPATGQDGSVVQVLPNGQMVVQTVPSNGYDNVYMTVGMDQGLVGQPLQFGAQAGVTGVTLPGSAQPVYQMMPALPNCGATTPVPVQAVPAAGGVVEAMAANTHAAGQQQAGAGGAGGLVMVGSSDESSSTPLGEQNPNTSGKPAQPQQPQQQQQAAQNVTGLTTSASDSAGAAAGAVPLPAGGQSTGGQLVLDRAAQQALLKQLLAKQGIDAVMAE